MARSKLALLILLLLASFGVAQAQTLEQPPRFLIYNVWVRPTAPAPVDGATPEPPLPGTVSGAYMTIQNVSDEDYTLVNVSDTIAEMTMLHEMSVNDKGLMQMHMIDHLDIPAGQTVMLASNGYHAMLMNVTEDIYPGEAVPLTLTFADSKGITSSMVVAAVATDTPPSDNSIIAANAVAGPSERDLGVSLILENRGDEADTLMSITSNITKSGVFVQPPPPNVSTTETITTSLEIPAHTQIVLGPPEMYIRMERLKPSPPSAFAFTLTFASGKTITLAAPVFGAIS